MKIFLGDFRVPIDCELISYDKLQEINDNPKEDVCGLYVSKYNKIYITAESNVPALDILMHELSHAIIEEQKTLRTEEHHLEHIGMGCDRKKPNQKHFTAVPLNRVMHTEVHAIGLNAWQSKYNVQLWQEAYYYFAKWLLVKMGKA